MTDAYRASLPMHVDGREDGFLDASTEDAESARREIRLSMLVELLRAIPLSDRRKLETIGDDITSDVYLAKLVDLDVASMNLEFVSTSHIDRTETERQGRAFLMTFLQWKAAQRLATFKTFWKQEGRRIAEEAWRVRYHEEIPMALSKTDQQVHYFDDAYKLTVPPKDVDLLTYHNTVLGQTQSFPNPSQAPGTCLAFSIYDSWVTIDHLRGLGFRIFSKRVRKASQLTTLVDQAVAPETLSTLLNKDANVSQYVTITSPDLEPVRSSMIVLCCLHHGLKDEQTASLIRQQIDQLFDSDFAELWGQSFPNEAIPSMRPQATDNFCDKDARLYIRGGKPMLRSLPAVPSPLPSPPLFGATN